MAAWLTALKTAWVWGGGGGLLPWEGGAKEPVGFKPTSRAPRYNRHRPPPAGAHPYGEMPEPPAAWREDVPWGQTHTVGHQTRYGASFPP